MTFPLIAMLTDFGDADGFAGVMKGVIYTVIQTAGLTDPVPLVDISHRVAPQDIRHGSWILASCLEHFPSGTIFLSVVDPKVGDQDQHKLLAHWESRNFFFIAPDNGLLSPVFEQADYSLRVYRIENPDYFHKKPPSQTFHGRDIYAPVAAHLACALHSGQLDSFLEALGPQTGDFLRLASPKPIRRIVGHDIYAEGEIAYIDTFGNLITNIPNDWLSEGKKHANSPEVEVRLLHHEWKTQHLGAYVQGADLQGVFLVPGSSGHIELCLYGGNAQKHLDAQVTDIVSFRWRKSLY